MRIFLVAYMRQTRRLIKVSHIKDEGLLFYRTSDVLPLELLHRYRVPPEGSSRFTISKMPYTKQLPLLNSGEEVSIFLEEYFSFAKILALYITIFLVRTSLDLQSILATLSFTLSFTTSILATWLGYGNKESITLVHDHSSHAMQSKSSPNPLSAGFWQLWNHRIFRPAFTAMCDSLLWHDTVSGNLDEVTESSRTIRSTAWRLSFSLCQKSCRKMSSGFIGRANVTTYLMMTSRQTSISRNNLPLE